jgi:DNA-binding MarR family transcriptional regulator
MKAAILAGALERRLKTGRTISDPAARALLNLDVASGHVLEQLEAITMTEGLSRSAYNILRILGGEPEGHPRGEIAARMVVHRTDVTRLIDGLARRGLANRVRPTIDRRLSVTRITPKGARTLQRLQPVVEAMIERYRRKLTQPELIELNRLLERLYGDER